jgi:hypothetical protein
MNVYRTAYVSTDFFKDNSLLVHTWLPASIHMSAEAYKMEVLNYANCVLEYRPLYVIFDLTDFFYTILPELQEWSSENGSKPSMKLGVKKIGIVVSKDFFATISVEQTVEEYEEIFMITRYFKSMQDAHAWISE